jgi:hypothetical protein
MYKQCGTIIFSPSDLIRYLASPFASWLDRYYLENRGPITPDEQTDEEKLLSRTGDEHEQSILSSYKTSNRGLVEIAKDNFEAARTATLTAIKDKSPIIYQAALQDGAFAGFADFLILDISGKYQVWVSRARNCTTRPAGCGLPLAPSTPHAIGTRRRCCPTARCWWQEDETSAATMLAARNCTTRPAGLGVPRAASPTHATFTRRRCCPTARCSSLEVLAAPAAISRARNCTIRPPRPGPPPATSAPDAICTRRRCCPTARCWWQRRRHQRLC